VKDKNLLIHYDIIIYRIYPNTVQHKCVCFVQVIPVQNLFNFVHNCKVPATFVHNYKVPATFVHNYKVPPATFVHNYKVPPATFVHNYKVPPATFVR